MWLALVPLPELPALLDLEKTGVTQRLPAPGKGPSTHFPTAREEEVIVRGTAPEPEGYHMILRSQRELAVLAATKTAPSQPV